jgi:predicted exporter
LEFNGNLRALNFVPEDIKRVEATLREAWGDFRGQAMVVVEGPDLESALMRNEDLFRYLQPRLGSEHMLSLAPVLPSAQTQDANRDRWRSFWSPDRIEKTRLHFEEEARRMGFRIEAFGKVWRQLETPPDRITKESLRAAGLGDLIDSLILSFGTTVRIVTLIPDTREIAAWFEPDASGPPGVRLVSQQRFSRIITAVVARDFTIFIGCTLATVTLLLIGLFRQLVKVLLSLIPVGTGLVGAAGFMGAFGYPVNIFNVVASILIIGLGVEYGIFMVARLSQGVERITERAVLLSSLTTLVGFGSLIFARHPALNSIGLAVLLGIGGAALSALVVLPAFYRTKWIAQSLLKGHRS